MRLRCARCGCYVKGEVRQHPNKPRGVGYIAATPCARCVAVYAGRVLREAQYTTDKEWMELLGDEFYYPMRLVEE